MVWGQGWGAGEGWCGASPGMLLLDGGQASGELRPTLAYPPAGEWLGDHRACVVRCGGGFQGVMGLVVGMASQGVALAGLSGSSECPRGADAPCASCGAQVLWIWGGCVRCTGLCSAMGTISLGAVTPKQESLSQHGMCGRPRAFHVWAALCTAPPLSPSWC